MSQSIAIPFWLLALLAFMAAIAILDRVLAPGMRWYFRRKVNLAINELNHRLDMRIQPFKLTRRQTLIDQLMYDEQIMDTAEKEANETKTPLPVVMKKAERYAREIVPSFSPLAYFGIGTRLARIISQLAYRVRLGYVDDESLKKIDPHASVIFVMNHRSNMDYVLVTYLASTRTTLSYAVGEWAQIWGLSGIIRAMGAYFIRRASNNELYRKVLARYVSMATREGVTQAVFPEGGLSRDGKLGKLKLGLLSYMVGDFSQRTSRDIIFVPVGINYDRVIEDRILTKSAEAEASGRDFSVSIPRTLAFAWHLMVRRFQHRLYRYGYACVSFGHPISFREWLDERDINFGYLDETERFERIEELGNTLLEEVGRVIPVLPVSVTATVLLRAGKKSLSEFELKSRAFDVITLLEEKGCHVHVPRHDRDYAVSAGLRILMMRHAVLRTDDGLYKANPDEKVMLTYYANSIAHLL